MPNTRTPDTPAQEELHLQQLQDTYKRLAASDDFAIFYAAMREKIQAARSQLPICIVTEEDKQRYNQLIGFIQGLETMFLTVRKYVDEAR